MRKYKSLLIFTLLSLFLLPQDIWAAEEIQATLVQPAIYKAKSGDPYSLELQMTLPKNYENTIQSIAVSVLLDANLVPVSESLKGATIKNSAYKINHSKLSQSNKALITLAIPDLKALNGAKTISLIMNTKIETKKSDLSSLKNSYVLSYIDKSGVEKSFQKDTITTQPQDGGTNSTKAPSVVINPTYAYSKILEGKAMPGANIKVYRGETLIAYGKSNENGSFQIVMNPQPEGAVLRLDFESQNGKVSQETTILEEKVPVTPPVNQVEGMDILKEYLEAVSNLPKDNLSQEFIYQIEAALSMGKYFTVKADVTSGEVEYASKQLKDAYKSGRPAFMNGYPEGTFEPNKAMVRSEVAAVMTKLMTNGEERPSFSSFKDVSDSKWYAGSVGFMEKNGIINGYLDGTFKPENSITRAEFASLIAKYMKLDSTNQAKKFPDVKSNAWYADSIAKVSSAGIMNGREDGRYGPTDKITRQEVATALNKVIGRKPNETIISKYGKNPFKDVKKTSWAYYQIMEATGN